MVDCLRSLHSTGIPLSPFCAFVRDTGHLCWRVSHVLPSTDGVLVVVYFVPLVPVSCTGRAGCLMTVGFAVGVELILSTLFCDTHIYSFIQVKKNLLS